MEGYPPFLHLHPPSHHVAWRGVAWRDVARRGVAWRGAAWRGVARRVAVRGVTLRQATRMCYRHLPSLIVFRIIMKCGSAFVLVSRRPARTVARGPKCVSSGDIRSANWSTAPLYPALPRPAPPRSAPPRHDRAAEVSD